MFKGNTKHNMIDVNTEEDDIIEEKVSYENLSVQEMLDSKMRTLLCKSAKEEYVDDIINIILKYRDAPELNKEEMSLYKWALEQIDGIYGIQKNKEPLKVITRAGTMADIQNRLK